MSKRLVRINEVVRAVLSEAVGDLSDPRLGFVTITSVEVARDMSVATVRFSVLGDDHQRQRTKRALQAAHGVLQHAVAREVKLRNTPQLRFEIDAGIDNAMRVAQLLGEDGDS